MCIKSILDTDFYKFSTSYAYMKMFPDAEGTFEFCDRDKTVYDAKFLEMLRIELANLAVLKLFQSEFNFVKAEIRFIPQCYWEWLNSFRFDFGKIVTYLDEEGHLQINVTDKLYKVTLYETPILAIVSEVRNRWLGNTVNMGVMKAKLGHKVAYHENYPEQLKPNSNCSRCVAVAESLKLKPTAGLGITDSDLDEIGAESYDQVDRILKCLTDSSVSTDTIDDIPDAILDAVVKRHNASKFKRKQLPIKITRDEIV